MKVNIIGGGGHAKIIIDILRCQNRKIYGIYDDNLTKGSKINGIKVRGKISNIPITPRRLYICAVGDNQTRRKIVENLGDLRWTNAIHPSAIISKEAKIGVGNCICAGAIIQTNAVMGDHSTVNTGTKIDHDCVIGNYVHVAPGTSVCGNVEIKDLTMVGVGSCVIQGIKIGSNVMIGSSSNVVKNIPDNVLAYGNPCKIVSNKENSLPKWPRFEKNEIDAVLKVLESGKVNQWTGVHVKAFEREFAEYVGTSYAVAIANGTLALELALKAIELSEGDEVIVTPRSFIASASSISITGGVPVFADIDPDTQNITVDTIKEKITDKTKAVICVHLAGWPCDMDPIVELCKSKGIYVLEDCAQAHGAKYKGRNVGSLSDIACWSFCQDKIITTGGEGGMITLNDEKMYKRAWSYKDHGKDYDMIFNSNAPKGYRRIYTSFGSNWRLTEMQAVIGREMLKRLDHMVQARRAHAEYLDQQLSNIEHIKIVTPPDDIYHSYYRYYFFVDQLELRNGLISAVKDSGLPCFTGSCSELYLEAAFGEGHPRLEVSHQMGDQSVCLLVDHTVERETLSKICSTIREFIQNN